MSAIDPEQKAIVQELLKRRATLPTEKQAIVDELGRRMGLNASTPPDAEMSAAMRQVQSTIPQPALPVPPEEEKLPLQLGPFKTAVQLPKFGQIPRLVNEGLGALSAVTNTQLPAGDTPRPNVLPELTPEQQFGQNAANVAMLGKTGLKVGKDAVAVGKEAVKGFLERPMEPAKAAVKAIKPLATNVKFATDTELAFPYMKAAEAELGHPIESVQDWLDSTKIGKKAVWQKYADIAGPKSKEQVYGGSVADAIEASISKKLQIQDPKAAQRIKDLANTYRRKFDLETLDDMLTTTNAELESYYAKYPAARAAAAEANPDIAQNVAEAKALRELIYGRLGENSKELKQTYGALKNMEKEGQRRLNVAARQNPDSLSEQLSRWQAAAKGIKGGFQILTGRPLEGAGNILEATAGRQMATALKQANSSDAMIANLFKNYDKLPPPMRTLFTQPQPFKPTMAEATVTQPVGAGIGAVGQAQKLDNAVNTRLQEFREVVRSGATEMTGKGIRGASGKIEGRHGGGIKITFPELADFPQSPGELADAIERGKGPLYDRIVKAVRGSLDIPAIDEGLFFGPSDNPMRSTGLSAARKFLEKTSVR